MHVFVATASKHGATRQMATWITEVLRRRGHTVDHVDIDGVGQLDDRYDAFVIGSAVYLGNWMKEARDFLDEHHDILDRRPLWLFSSGPLGNERPSTVQPGLVGDAATRVTAVDHRMFSGRYDPARCSRRERMVVRMVRAPVGDFRDRHEVERWAHEIADALARPATPSVPRTGRAAVT